MKVLLLIAAVFGVTAYAKVLPDYFPECKRDDPDVAKCVHEGIERMRPYLIKGIPEFNIPAIDPISIPTLKIDRTAPSLRLKAVVKNMIAYGGSSFKIENFKLNLKEKFVGEATLTIPKVRVAGDYDVRGSRVLVIDLDGKGKMTGNFSDLNVIAKGNAKMMEKDGVHFLQLDKIITKVKIGHGQMNFDDLERPLVAVSAATFFNANPQVVLDLLNPLIEETAAAVFKAIFNKVLSAIPIKEVLVDL